MSRCSQPEAAAAMRSYRDVRSVSARACVEIERIEQRSGVTVDGIEARLNRIAQANRDYPAIVGEYGAIGTIPESFAPAREGLLDHLRSHDADHRCEFTEDRFKSGDITLDCFPVRGRRHARDAAGALRPDGDVRLRDANHEGFGLTFFRAPRAVRCGVGWRRGISAVRDSGTRAVVPG